jgi:hypothetical protein
MINLRKVRSLQGGYSTDITDNVERKDTYQKAIGGRLYSKNGVFSFSGGKGTKLVYQNTDIVKYLGYESFKDEVIIFAKCLKGVTLGGTIVTECTTNLIANSFSLLDDANNNVAQAVVAEISDNTSLSTICYDVEVPPVNPTDFETNFSCDDVGVPTTIDFGEYYTENANVPNQLACALNLNEIPLNNTDYNDCLYSLRLDSNYALVGTLLWVGTQNWPVNGKITTEGVDENEFYKRVYYTDAVNPKRVVNIKDPSLAYRTESDFNQILNNILLQPEIVEVGPGGQLKAMKSLYVYRVISSNGQLSEFSPSSFYANVLVETTAIKYRGGDVSELTGSKVTVNCNIINPDSTSEIECIALEYEAFGPPTAIRNLGRKSASNVVQFEHFGNEEEFADNITYNDIIDFKNTWKFCNDFTSKKNKLIAGGLRNEPLPTEINNLEYLFPLHSWKDDGTTFDCLMNPEPWNYRYIDPSNTDDLIYIKEKVYRTISSFGPLTLKFKNIDVANEIEITFSSLTLEAYTNINGLVIAWLLDQQANNVNWNTYFPNLDIVDAQGQLLLTPTIPGTPTDMANYVFESNNSQFIENFDNNIEFLPITVDLSNLVHGAQSLGFSDGTGIRVTYREFKEPLLNQATAVYDGTGKVLDYITPSGEKYCFKGEIYRIGFQAYNNDSTRFFAIPLGDIMIPNLGDLKSTIDDAGNAIITSEKYVNQSVENGILYGYGIKMHIEVRLSCDLQALIPMYQIVYVERDEDNRTIICQGISAPLERVQDNGNGDILMPVPLRNKWNLPYYGGPTYEKNGFLNYDTYTENDQYIADGPERRVMTHRALMYFDSPDLYYNKVSDQYISNSELNIVAKLNTDHTPEVIRESGRLSPSYGAEVYPKFSRKILGLQVEGDNHAGSLPLFNIDQGNEDGTDVDFFINVSVYANYAPFENTHQIEVNETLNYGEIISGSALNTQNDVSNNAACMPSQPWYYGGYQRDWKQQQGRTNATAFRGNRTSPGYKTVILKTSDDLFTDAFLGNPLPAIDSQIRLGGYDYSLGYDTIPLINIFRNNRESVYGGRSIEAYSQNTYIPLSRTIPTLKSSTNAQIFDVGADTYITLNIRTKNDYGDDPIVLDEFNNGGSARARGDLQVWLRNGAWCYAVVLETQVEPKFTYQYEFYRETTSHNFDISRGEIINTAYFNENGLKSYIPKPFKFQDDPNQGHVIAVSDVKLAGEYFDAWTRFKPNNFYAELERNKGDLSNFVKEDEQVFAIQGQQTSLIYIGTDRIISDAEGSPINLQQGSGTVVDGHKIMSNYGTSFRRAVTESDYGFCFFDERKVEFIKIIQPLLAQNFLHLEYFDRFKTNKIIDTEAWFDQEHKETCIRLKTEDGTNFMLSYNEVLKKFNGEFPIEYDKDIFIEFDEKIYAPITTVIGNDILSADLHQLNEGDILNFFGVQTDMILGLYVNADIDKVFQYKQWGIITNIDYPVTSVFGKSNLGYDRTILGTHNWYKIREGIHTVPMINETNNFHEVSDVRGNWVYIEMTVESLNKNKVDILAVLNDIRYSHQ